ncbi:MAG: PAS domain-containing protein, partial [Bdellovibrionales bacterium]|nr:PAS domain-containing protein [Bdellovibrionales bacterium]
MEKLFEPEEISPGGSSKSKGLDSSDLKNTLPNLEHFHVIFQSIAEAVFVQDRNFRCVYANDMAAQQCGFDSVEELLNTPMDQVMARFKVTDEMGKPFPANQFTVGRALQGEALAETTYYRYSTKGSSRRIIKSQSRPVYDKSGEIPYAVTIFRDITSERESENHARLLADASHIFSSSLDLNETLQSLGDLVVPRLADWFEVELVNPQGELEVILVKHRDPEEVKKALKYRKEYPELPNELNGIYRVFRSVRREVHNSISSGTFDTAVQCPDHLDWLKSLKISSMLLIPLKVREKTLGVMTLCNSGSHKNFSSSELELATELAHRASFAIENSKLYSSVQDEKAKLQLAIEAAKLGIFDWQIEKQTLEGSNRALEIFAIPKKGSIDRNQWLGRIHPQDRERYDAVIAQALHHQTDYNLEYRIIHPDSQIVWVFESGHPYFDKTGQATRVTGTLKDITWKKEADIIQSKMNQLQQIANQLSNKIEPKDIAQTILSEGVSPIGAFEGRVFLKNEASETLQLIYSQKQGEATRSSQVNFENPSDELLRQCLKENRTLVLKSKSTSGGDAAQRVVSPMIVHRRNLGIMEFRFSETVDINAALLEYVQILSNHAAQSIDRGQVFQSAQKARKRADAANRAKSTFLANMSHEIR